MQAGPGPELLDADEEGGIFGEINITPLTDVFLVLLIILMVVSSSMIEDEKSAAYEKGLLAERALEVMTPEGSADRDLQVEDVVISVLPDRTVFVENDEVALAALDDRLSALAGQVPQPRIVLRGDRTASYDVVMDLISRCNRAGLGNIALASREPGGG
jgi:biopolymer transport protein ExbD